MVNDLYSAFLTPLEFRKERYNVFLLHAITLRVVADLNILGTMTCSGALGHVMGPLIFWLEDDLFYPLIHGRPRIMNVADIRDRGQGLKEDEEWEEGGQSDR